MVLYSVMEQQQTFRTRNFSPQELRQPMLCHVPRQPQHQTQGESNQSFQTGTDHCRSIPISSEASAGKWSLTSKSWPPGVHKPNAAILEDGAGTGRRGARWKVTRSCKGHLGVMWRSCGISLVPGSLADPAQGEASVCADLDGGCLGLTHGLFHRLHQVLSVVYEHLCGLHTHRKTWTHTNTQAKTYTILYSYYRNYNTSIKYLAKLI